VGLRGFRMGRLAKLGEEQERLARELQAAYLAMSEEGRQAEVSLAEEGLREQPSPTGAFPGEDKWLWWR